jgi:hypothetical protein
MNLAPQSYREVKLNNRISNIQTIPNHFTKDNNEGLLKSLTLTEQKLFRYIAHAMIQFNSEVESSTLIEEEKRNCPVKMNQSSVYSSKIYF